MLQSLSCRGCSAGGLKKLWSFDLFPCIYAQGRPAETTICMGIGLEEGLIRILLLLFFWLLMTNVIGMTCRCRMWHTRSKQTYVYVQLYAA
jgi:hypothetical protein